VNKLIIIGNLTHDPVSRTVAGDKSVCNFNVAVNQRRGDNRCIFFRVAVWGKAGENCQRFLAKGSKVMVEGNVSSRAYSSKEGEAKASLEVFAEDVEFLYTKPREPEQKAEKDYHGLGDFTELPEDELPFN
jgi:single-strand DNA-binding protein